MVQVATDAAHLRDGTSGLIPPSTAGNLWLEFMRAYRRKRRPLTYNPTSLIGKDPYIVAMRLERGEF